MDGFERVHVVYEGRRLLLAALDPFMVVMQCPEIPCLSGDESCGTREVTY